MRLESTAAVRTKNVQARVTPAEMALLDRACARMKITRTEAVYRWGIERLIKEQRQLEERSTV